MNGITPTQGVVDIDGWMVNQDWLGVDLLLRWPLAVVRVLKHNHYDDYVGIGFSFCEDALNRIKKQYI